MNKVNLEDAKAIACHLFHNNHKSAVKLWQAIVEEQELSHEQAAALTEQAEEWYKHMLRNKGEDIE